MSPLKRAPVSMHFVQEILLLSLRKMCAAKLGIHSKNRVSVSSVQSVHAFVHVDMQTLFLA